MFCYKCNHVVQRVEDGWMCFHCGQNGADATPVATVDEAILSNRPLKEPLK
jgi:ribosomal protein L37AE/L43A